MINMAVISLKDIIKYLVKITIIITIVVGLTRYFLSVKNNKENNSSIEKSSEAEVISENNSKDINKSSSEVKRENQSESKGTNEDQNENNKQLGLENNWQNFLSCLDISIPAISQINNKENSSSPKENKTIEDILSVNLGVIDNLNSDKNNKQMAEKDAEDENTNNVGNNGENSNEINNKPSENIEHAETGLKTEVLKSNVSPRYSQEYYGVKIRNETDYKLTNEVLDPSKLEINKDNIIIYQTHSCESYTASEKYQYKQTGNFRTTDKNFSVIRVGRELTEQLKSYGYNIIHDENYHDYPSYTGSYTSSLNTVTKLLEENKNTDIVIDVHRDAVGDNKYAPTVKIGDEYAAQIMFVVGGNGSSIPHLKWQQNLKFAIKVQQKANEMYPGLFKPIILRESGYNQQVSKAASLIEVGATGNTLDQCLISMKYLAKVLDEVLSN